MINWRSLQQSACTHTNKHFISKMINKTKPTAFPTNVSVNCFRARKHPLHQMLQEIRETREVLRGWEHLLGCELPLPEAVEGKLFPRPRAGPGGPCSSAGFGALPENPFWEITPDKAVGVGAFWHVWAHSEDCPCPPPM